MACFSVMSMNKYTEHFLSRQVFASLWGICFLAALRRSTPIRLPFDNQYKRFMADHEQEFSQLLDMLQESTGLSSESITTGKQDAPWLYLTESSADYDEISLNITLSLKAGKINADDRSILQFDYLIKSITMKGDPADADTHIRILWFSDHSLLSYPY
jgi:hypothetical protein